MTLTASDPQGYTLTISGDIGGTPFTCATGNVCFQPLPQGNGVITYQVTASQGGMSASGSTAWKLDATPPSINGTLSGATGSNSWYLGAVNYNGAASDSLSGLANVTCSLNGSSVASCNSIMLNNEGVHTLSFTAKDNAGNINTFNQSVSIDLQNPSLTSGINGTLGSNGWYNAAILNASASDPGTGSGLSALSYALDGGSWTAFPASGSLDLLEGAHSLEVRASDMAGRITTSTKSYSLDATLPTIVINPSGTLGNNHWYTSDLSLSVSATDGISGMDIFEYSLNSGAWATYSSPLILSDGTHNISFWAQDKAGLVKQVNEIYQVDTHAPQITGSLSGVPGANGWYISQVTVNASAADPAHGSGMEAFTYILNGGAQTTYTSPIILPDGQHAIQFDARDFAGLTDAMIQSIKVDTVTPSLNILTTLPTWNKETITLNGTAGDMGSGLSKVEISIDGVNWQTVNGTTSWSHVWDTTSNASGQYQLRVCVTDHAGLTTEQIITAGVDNSPPKISLPDTWLQWDTVTLDVWDNDSGLSDVQVEISDPEGRWKTRKIDLDPDSFPLNFKWDRRFGDDTIAPLGTYPIKVIAHDMMGNMKQANATVNILLGILPAGPAATSQPYIRIDSTPQPVSTPATFASPAATSTPMTSTFGSAPVAPDQTQGDPVVQTESNPSVSATPRTAPTQTTVIDWFESIFAPNEVEESTTDISTPETDPTMHWDATLAAMAAAVTAYTLAEQKKKEEEARKRKEAANARLEKEARERAELQKIWDANGAAIYEANQAFKSAVGKDMDAATKNKAIKDATVNSVFNAGSYTNNLNAAITQQSLKDMRTDQKAVKLEVEMQSRSAQPQGWQADYNAYMTQKAAQEAMEDYRAGEKEGYAVVSEEEQATQTNWWEETKKFVNDKVVQPANETVYQPFIKPAIETVKDNIVRMNENFYEPKVKPAIKAATKAVETYTSWWDENIYSPIAKPIAKVTTSVTSVATSVAADYISWWNETLYQPIVVPAIKVAADVAANYISWWDENLYQPLVTPVIETATEIAGSYFSWWDETIHQPYIQPKIDKNQKRIADGISWLNNNIYQPIFEPVVNDINKYVYQPISDTTEKIWGKYGEWVHNGLDAVGFIPGLGEIADGLNGLIYLGEGRYIEAAVSAMAMIPLLGDLGKAGKWTVKAGQEILEEAVEKVAKEVAEEVLEKTVKEVATEAMEDVAEKTIKETGEELAAKVVKDSLEEAAEKKIEKAVMETAQELAEKASNGTAEAISSKVLAESLEKTVKEAATETVEEVVEKTIKETGEELATKVVRDSAEKSTKKTAEALSSKVLAESVENSTTKVITEKVTGNVVVKNTVDGTLAKAAKNSTEAIVLEGTEKLSKEAKDALVKQALEKVDDKTGGATPFQWRHGGFRILGYEHAALRTDWVKDSRWLSAVDADCTNLR